MIIIEGHNVDTYWVVLNDDNTIIHYGLVLINNVVESGFNRKLTFIDKNKWFNELIRLGVILSLDELEYYNL